MLHLRPSIRNRRADTSRQGLIAINYPARAAGIGRHCNVDEAKKLCPELIAQHVATWREGDDMWAYRDDSAANIATDKVSLDPYRLQSRRILAVVKESLPRDMQKVEKASVDEVFVDLSAQVHAAMLARFPGELSGPPPYDDPTEKLPLPPVAALDWQADALVDLDEEQETLDPDWDDVATLIGSEIVRDIRARIREILGYTSSAGVAGNKLLSKLGSGHKKPNAQTVIRARAASAFLGDFKLTKLRNLGGKLGEQVVSAFNTDNVAELRAVSLGQLKSKLGDETGLWVYNTARGIDLSEVNSRTQIKSMLSAKSFRPSISTPEQAIRWLRIFVADIHARLVEEGVLENKRRPRTINLHHRHGGYQTQAYSRQMPIMQGKALDETVLLDLAKDLLGQTMAEGKLWPCANLSLSVGGFEDGVKGNMGIGAFLVRGEEAEALKCPTPDSRQSAASDQPPAKKRRAEGGVIQKFFSKTSESDAASPGPDGGELPREVDNQGGAKGPLVDHDDGSPTPAKERTCSRCDAPFDNSEELQSHDDWHLAMDLQAEERGRPILASRPAQTARAAAPISKRGRPRKMESGQSRLKFG